VVILGPLNKPSPPVAEVLATDQTLSFPIAQDVADLDPAQMSSPTDVDVFRNVFSGLYKFDQSLHEVPDIAVGPADVSTDGLTYTFHLRHDAVFSNGDPITADDFIYSWNRAAAKQGDYAGLFNVVAGYDAVAAAADGQHLDRHVALDALIRQADLSEATGYAQDVPRR